VKYKKIVFTHLLNDYSGSPKVLSQVIKACQKQGREVELYTGKGQDGFLSGLSDKHHYYFYKRFENKYFTLVTFMLSQLSLFYKLLKHRNENIVIYVNTMLPFGAGLAGLLMDKPVYYHVHEISLQPASFKRFLRFIVQKSASRIIFVSKAVEEAELFLNIDQRVVYNALSDDYTKALEHNSYRWKNGGRFAVLMICSLKEYKGINEFVEIARQCEQYKEISFTLILNAEQSEINFFFSKMTLPSNVILLARLINPIPYYQQSSLLINLSRVDECIETFGLTIIEAMAFGIPVIVPPVGGPVEIVTDDVEGYLISSYDEEKIAQKIIELSKDEAKCLELSIQTKKRAKYYMPEAFEKNILRVISE
jgi:glycosyltransferase involved in cell wall biosynthesis